MIREIEPEDIPACVHVIKTAFSTVARELGITAENAPRFTAFATNEKKDCNGNIVMSIDQCLRSVKTEEL